MICVCVAVDLVGGGGSPPPGSCCHLQADCLEYGISSGPLRSIYTIMSTFTFLLSNSHIVCVPSTSQLLWSVRLLSHTPVLLFLISHITFSLVFRCICRSNSIMTSRLESDLSSVSSTSSTLAALATLTIYTSSTLHSEI